MRITLSRRVARVAWKAIGSFESQHQGSITTSFPLLRAPWWSRIADRMNGYSQPVNRLLTVRLLMGWSLVMVVTFGVPAGAQGSPPPGLSGLEDAAAASCVAPATHGFNDVPTNHFANLAVGWLVGAGITSGTSPGTYSPSQPVTRAQMAVFLWRAAGGPTPVGPHGFNDVPAGHFAGTAVGWLVGAGITSGTSPGTYSPSQPVTRAQMAVFLWRPAWRKQCSGVCC